MLGAGDAVAGRWDAACGAGRPGRAQGPGAVSGRHLPSRLRVRECGARRLRSAASSFLRPPPPAAARHTILAGSGSRAPAARVREARQWPGGRGGAAGACGRRGGGRRRGPAEARVSWGPRRQVAESRRPGDARKPPEEPGRACARLSADARARGAPAGLLRPGCGARTLPARLVCGRGRVKGGNPLGRGTGRLRAARLSLSRRSTAPGRRWLVEQPITRRTCGIC